MQCKSIVEMPVLPLCSHTQKYRTCLSKHFRLVRIGNVCGSQTLPCGHQPEVTWRGPVCVLLSCAPKWAIALYLSFIIDKNVYWLFLLWTKTRFTDLDYFLFKIIWIFFP